MTSLVRKLLLGLWLCALTSVHAQHAPVDCARPQAWAEQMLCTDSELMEMHTRTMHLYEERRRQLDGAAHMDLVSYQRGWLRARDECQSAADVPARVGCLKDLYKARQAQLGITTPAPATPAPALTLPPDPTLIACRGDLPSWAMDLGARSARLRIGSGAAVQELNGRLAISVEHKTYAWRAMDKAGTAGVGDIVAIMMDGNCSLQGVRARFPLLARVSLPDGSLMVGCCQRTPVAAVREAPPAVPRPVAPSFSTGAGGVALPGVSQSSALEKLLAAGTKVRLRDVDGVMVPLRKSTRISSGNILTKTRAGTIATIEQAAAKEGISWYFIALPNGDTKGWVMGEHVESLMDTFAPEALSKRVKERSDSAPVAAKPMAPQALESVAEEQPARRAVEVFSGALAPVRGEWWRNVSEHLPVIDACIQKAHMRTARVVKLEASAEGGREVYLRDGLNHRVACDVRAAQPVQARAFDVNELFPHGSGPLFTRAPGNPLPAKCYRSERVRDPRTRTLVGWLSYAKPGRRC